MVNGETFMTFLLQRVHSTKRKRRLKPEISNPHRKMEQLLVPEYLGAFLGILRNRRTARQHQHQLLLNPRYPQPPNQQLYQRPATQSVTVRIFPFQRRLTLTGDCVNILGAIIKNVSQLTHTMVSLKSNKINYFSIIVPNSLEGQITLSADYSNEYNDEKSPIYKKLIRDLENEIKNALSPNGNEEFFVKIIGLK